VTLLLLTLYRSLVEIGTNYAGAESEKYMACGALNFDMDPVGRRAIYLIIADIRKNFNGKVWGSNGPDVVRRVIRFICGTNDVSMISLNVCFIYKSGVQPFRCVPLGCGEFT
jgi:lactosylceramide 4-alpha-galactosyltransferase